MSPLSRRVHHVAVAVREMEAGLAFYRDALGLSLAKRAVLPEMGVEVALLRLANAEIELLRPLDASSSVGRFLDRRGEGLHHVCLTTPDIEAEMTQLRQRGVELVDAQPREGIAGRVCFLQPRAMAGVLVELVQPEREAAADAALPGLAEVLISVDDLEETIGAWRRAFGFAALIDGETARIDIEDVRLRLQHVRDDGVAGLASLSLGVDAAGANIEAAAGHNFLIRLMERGRG